MDPAVNTAVFFSDFGIPAVISQPGLPDKTDLVIFDRLSMGDMGVMTDKPQITASDSFLSGTDLTLATINVKGDIWRMTKPLPDGAGMTTVLLTRT